MSSFDLNERVIIITGGAGLLGEQYTYALVNAGARVVLADLNPVRGLQVAQKADPSGTRVIAVATDVSNKASVEAMVGQTMAHFGSIYGLLNNAALDPKFDQSQQDKHSLAFEDYPLEAWNVSLAVNLTGMFLCAQAAAPVMLKSGEGVIVNVCSTYGLVGPDQRLYVSGDPTLPPRFKPVDYSVTKSAALGLTRYLAAYYAGRNLRVNALTLGGVFDDHDPEFVRRYSARAILGRMARRDEYCGAVVFLFSDASSYMTGANLVVDGGWTAW